jgi:hypothetical protein
LRSFAIASTVRVRSANCSATLAMSSRVVTFAGFYADDPTRQGGTSAPGRAPAREPGEHREVGVKLNLRQPAHTPTQKPSALPEQLTRDDLKTMSHEQVIGDAVDRAEHCNGHLHAHGGLVEEPGLLARSSSRCPMAHRRR